MRIAVGSDHAGYEDPPPHYKPAVIEHLEQHGHTVIDVGCFGPDRVDYPDIAKEVCNAVLCGDADRGLLICGTGMGIAMAANRYKGIRATVCVTQEMARLARDHNNSNVLCLGRRIISLNECLDLIDIWLDTPFSDGPRHARRLGKMDGPDAGKPCEPTSQESDV